MGDQDKEQGLGPAEQIRFGEPRRYLVNIDSISTSQLFADCVIVGAGIAGLRAAIEAADHRNIVVVCKAAIEESNTWNAQGGIASVLREDDTFESHVADTLRTGGGIADPQVVEQVVRQAPELVRQLQDWARALTRSTDGIDTTLEGGHSHARILHAHGDETGRAIAETLIATVRSKPNIRVIEHFFTIDLLTDKENRCIGILGHSKDSGLQIVWAANTILATGGGGQLYRETTNPAVATGDGLAMAYRAGAVLRDLEFVQFHPTTLYVAGASRADHRDPSRRRRHPAGHQGPAVHAGLRQGRRSWPPATSSAGPSSTSMRKTDATHVYLDIRHIDKEHLQKAVPADQRVLRELRYRRLPST